MQSDCKYDEILTTLLNVEIPKREEEIPFITDEPKIPCYLYFFNEVAGEVTKGFDTKEVYGKGFYPNDTIARIKAAGEFLERLCLYDPEEKKFCVAKYEPAREFVDPACFRCYSEEQLLEKGIINFIEKSREAKYRWWPTTNLASKKECFVPAQLIFLSSIFNDEFPIRDESISTGAALGRTGTNQALTNGLMEVVERDACIFSYLTKRNLNKLSHLPEELNNLVEYFERYRLEPYIFDATSDLEIPTILAIVLDHTGFGPAVNVGSRSALNFEEAIKCALLESIQSRRLSRILKLKQFSGDKITSIEDRFSYWCPTERIHDLNFWLENSNVVHYDEIKNKNCTLDGALERLVSKNYCIFVTDITLPQIKEKGFEVLKVIVPELHPLYLDERAKALYSEHYGAIKEDTALKPHPLT